VSRYGSARPQAPSRVAAALLAASGGVASEAGLGGRRVRPRQRSVDAADYEEWLAHATERLDPMMAFLGIVFALLAMFELAGPGLSQSWLRVVEVATWAIWAAFVIDFVARLIAAPSAWRFLRHHWLALLMLAVPTLRVLRFGVLLRLGRALPAARVVSTSYRATGVARTLLRSRAAYLGAVAAVVTLAVAELAWLAERGTTTFTGFGDALLWAASTVIAMQGDPVPQTAFGRIVMLAGFAVGLVLVATLAGTVGAFLLEDHRERMAPDADRRRPQM
jgi:voltage-gated potassium channel